MNDFFQPFFEDEEEEGGGGERQKKETERGDFWVCHSQQELLLTN